MTQKKTSVIRSFEQSSIPDLERNLDRLYSLKLESRWARDNSSTAVTAHIYQAMEHGEVDFSATGSPTVARTFALAEVHGRIVYASAHAKSTLVTAHVTDVTSSEVTITVRSISGTANLSAVTTATVKVYFQVLGSSP